jgi:nucleoside-diphosphate-sugar epimerase
MRWSVADVSDLATVETLMREERPDIVFHLGGHVSGAQTLAQVQPTLVRNLTGAVNLMTAATEFGVRRIILPGSMQEPQRGEVQSAPCSPYAASQIASTSYARMFYELYRTPVVIARMMMVYGPGQWDSSKLLPYAITSLLRGSSPAVASESRMIDWVYVDDVVDGLISVATTPGLEGKTLDFGMGRLVSNREIVERVASIIGSGVPISFGRFPGRRLERPRAAQTKLTQDLTGWRATTDLDTGLRRTVEWFRRRPTDAGLADDFGLPSADRSTTALA